MIRPITSIEIKFEQDVVYARSRARIIAGTLDFDMYDQTRISTAVSEIARNTFQYARGGEVEFLVDERKNLPVLQVIVKDTGGGIPNLSLVLHGGYASKTGMGNGIEGVKHLMDTVHIETAPDRGTIITMEKRLPITMRPFPEEVIQKIVSRLTETAPQTPFEEIRVQNLELIQTMEALRREHVALVDANKKLNLLSSITRHDIKNQLAALMAYLDLAWDAKNNPDQIADYINRQKRITETINRQISFTRDYENMGVKAPQWQNVNAEVRKAVADLPMRDVRLSVDRTDLEIYADPLFGKVFYTIIDNALRYGGDCMTGIHISSHEAGTSLLLVCEDNGPGISAEDKKRLFTKGFGRNTGLGLFLIREILSITHITITENGTPGTGARFEITVPSGGFKYAGKP